MNYKDTRYRFGDLRNWRLDFMGLNIKYTRSHQDLRKRNKQKSMPEAKGGITIREFLGRCHERAQEKTGCPPLHDVMNLTLDAVEAELQELTGEGHPHYRYASIGIVETGEEGIKRDECAQKLAKTLQLLRAAHLEEDVDKDEDVYEVVRDCEFHTVEGGGCVVSLPHRFNGGWGKYKPGDKLTITISPASPRRRS